ncbi:MAG: class I SAM-dependent rRNA methyltransferase [Chthoniobacteraceae bacterium]
MSGLIIKPRSRIFHGHDWVYASEVQRTFGSPQPGDVVSVRGPSDQLLGSAIFNSHSQIIARRFSRQKQDLDADFFHRRIRQAIEYRKSVGANEHLCRLVWSESDGLPGLVIDRYGDHLVVQMLTAAMDLRREMIAAVLRAELSPVSIIERNDSSVRKAEGLELRTGVLHGEPPDPFSVSVGGLKFEVDLMQGQKTGFYLDQVSNYAAVAAQARGRRVLDCFSNGGGFALSCARAGASSVTAVDISSACVELTKRNAAANRLSVDACAANVFDLFKDLERRGEPYDLIILDPPSFTKSKGKLSEASRGYKEIHLRALNLLSPQGVLATFCCSHHVSSDHFRGIINDATVDAKRTLRQLASFTQGLDHPIIPTLPETEYLKGFLFDLVPGR